MVNDCKRIILQENCEFQHDAKMAVGLLQPHGCVECKG